MIKRPCTSRNGLLIPLRLLRRQRHGLVIRADHSTVGRDFTYTGRGSALVSDDCAISQIIDGAQLALAHRFDEIGKACVARKADEGGLDFLLTG